MLMLIRRFSQHVESWDDTRMVSVSYALKKYSKSCESSHS